jgi:energy-coupling factor transport system permease protein
MLVLSTLLLLFLREPLPLLAMVSYVIILLALSRLDINLIKKVVFGSAWIFFIAMVAHSCFGYYGGETFFKFGWIHITNKSIIVAIAMSLRILGLILLSIWFLTITSQRDIIYGFHTLGLPDLFCFILTLALRFFTSFSEDMITIREALMSRAVDFESGSIVERLRKRILMIVPLLFVVINRASIAVNALDSRAFLSGSKRTYHYAIPFKAIDYTIIMVFLIILTIILTAKYIYGYTI